MERGEVGADLLWRTKSNHILPIEERLADGSYLSVLHEVVKNTRRRSDVVVRVIEHELTDPGRTDVEPLYRLITTITDPVAAPAHELAALYPARWGIETTLGEMKTHQRGPRVVLRSKAPDGVVQELYGYLCVHYAIRWLMHTVALDTGEDPDRLSFTRTLRVARRSTASYRGFPPQALDGAHAQATEEILFEQVPARLRSNPRVVKRKMSSFPLKRHEHRNWPRPTKTANEAVVVVGVPKEVAVASIT